MVLPSLKLVLTGLIVGLIVAAPVGPVNILCIQGAVRRGFLGGLAAGIGAILADGLIAALSAFGVTAISGLITRYGLPLQLAGGLILIAFGLELFLIQQPRGGRHGGTEKGMDGLVRVVPQTFFLTITNPGAVLGMFAIFGGASTALGGLESFAEAATMVLAVMCGSLMWWVGLSALIARIRHKLTDQRLRNINQVAGLALLCFGAVLLLRAALGVAALLI